MQEVNDKIYNFRVLLFLKIHLLSLYQHIALHFEGKGNVKLMLLYREKIQCVYIAEIMAVVIPLTYNIRKFIGDIGILIATSFAFQKISANFMNIEIFIRLKYHLYYFADIYPNSKEKSSILLYLGTAIDWLERCINFFISCIYKLFDKY